MLDIVRRLRTQVTLLRFGIMALSAATMLLGHAVASLPASAQATAAPIIDVPAEITVPHAVLTPLQIGIRRAETWGSKAMVMVRGLPARVMLSEGRSFSPGVWGLPLASVGKIEIAPAHGIVGRSELTIELMLLDGTMLASARTVLNIVPTGSPSANTGSANGRSDSIALTVGPLAGKPQLPDGAAQSPSSIGAVAFSPESSRLAVEEIDRARKLVEKGDENLQAGKIAIARRFYLPAAEAGYAAAALALGATYDGKRLAQWKVVGGVQPDTELARQWYQKAKDLGSREADRHLRELSAR